MQRAIAAAGGPSGARDGLAWIDAVLEECADDQVRGSVRELAVDPIPVVGTSTDRYATGMVARLLERDTTRRIADLRGRLQRSDAGSIDEQQVLAEVMALEEYRRRLLDEALGDR